MPRSALALPVAAVVSLAVETSAQCSLQMNAVSGLDGLVRSAASWDPDGTGPLPPRALLGGTFTTAGGSTANGVAAWDPQTGSWSVFGSGIAGSVWHVVGLPGGEFAVAGIFGSAGGVPANNIVRWTGTAWAAMGAGLGSVSSMIVAPNGDLVVAHTGGVSRWDGSIWTLLGPAIPGGQLALAANGDIFVSGPFGISRWNGTAWVLYASGVTDVTAMACTPEGRLYVAAHFQLQDPQFAVFDGSTWTQLSPPLLCPFFGTSINDIEVLPDGGALFSGYYVMQGVGGFFMRYNASTGWTQLSVGTTTGTILTTKFLPSGELLIGSSGSASFATLRSTCPAQAAPAGTGCPSSGGANALAVETLPWIGGTYRARATGLPVLAIVVGVYGLSAVALPLASVLPQGQPGCILHVSPDFLDVSFAVGGTATTQLAIPAVAALVGVGFRSQLNVYEIDAGLNFLAITASNALSLTVGAF